MNFSGYSFSFFEEEPTLASLVSPTKEGILLHIFFLLFRVPSSRDRSSSSLATQVSSILFLLLLPRHSGLEYPLALPSPPVCSTAPIPSSPPRPNAPLVLPRSWTMKCINTLSPSAPPPLLPGNLLPPPSSALLVTVGYLSLWMALTSPTT